MRRPLELGRTLVKDAGYEVASTVDARKVKARPAKRVGCLDVTGAEVLVSPLGVEFIEVAAPRR